MSCIGCEAGSVLGIEYLAVDGRTFGVVVDMLAARLVWLCLVTTSGIFISPDRGIPTASKIKSLLGL